MATQAQINASRRNARRSTGPRTDAGKARVSRNAIRHGLRSKEPVEPDPSDAEFQELLANRESALEPANDLERDAALRIALALWRHNRVCRLEVELLSKADSDSHFVNSAYGASPDQPARSPTHREAEATGQNRLPGTLGYLARLIDDASRAVIRAIEHAGHVRELSFSFPELPQERSAPREQDPIRAR